MTTPVVITLFAVLPFCPKYSNSFCGSADFNISWDNADVMRTVEVTYTSTHIRSFFAKIRMYPVVSNSFCVLLFVLFKIPRGTFFIVKRKYARQFLDNFVKKL